MWYLLPIASLIDILLTYINIQQIRKVKRFKNNYYDFETNQLVVYLWKNIGLKKGTIVSGIFSILIMSILSFVFRNNDISIGFLFGLYFITIYAHIGNYFYLGKKYKKYY